MGLISRVSSRTYRKMLRLLRNTRSFTPLRQFSTSQILLKPNVIATQVEFDKEVIQKSQNDGVAVLVDFYADWCGPCRMLTPLLEKTVQDSNGKVSLVKIDVDDADEDLVMDHQIQAIPAVFCYKNGKQSGKHVGMMNELQLGKLLES